jgi:uncharacterized membrane-anchored protein YhcB (DUF1043 family)
MKISRLWMYATAGLVVGLLLENKTLLLKHAAELKARKLKNDAEKLLPHHN